MVNLTNSLEAVPVLSILLKEGEQLYKEEGHAMYNIANDNGYAFHKVAAWVVNNEGKRRISVGCSPSRAQLGQVNASVSGGLPPGMFVIDDTYYTVGGDVPDPEKIRGSSYATSELNNVLIANTLVASGLIEKAVRLATGLPLKQYFTSEGQRDESKIDKVMASLSPLAQPAGYDSDLAISEHVVMAESLSAFVDWYLDDEGKVANKVTNGVLFVDIGGGTTDISHITAKKQIYMDGSDTKQIGILDVFKKLKSLLSSKYQIEERYIRDDMLDTAIRTNNFVVRGQDNDCTEECKVAKKFVAKRLYNFINELVSGALDKIVFVGGGAEVLRNELLSEGFYEEGFAFIPKEPQNANVKGMLKMMTFVNKQENQ